MVKLSSLVLSAALAFAASSASYAADKYVIDTKGMHAAVHFRVKHLGYSWLYGRFNDFEGNFTYDAKDDSKNKVKVTVDMTSLDTNHAERDKHLSEKKYLNFGKYEKATFESTSYKTVGKDKAVMKGNLTLMGVTKPVEVEVDVIGGGEDPWGGYRQGFEGHTTIKSKDFGMEADVGEVELTWSIEGVRQ